MNTRINECQICYNEDSNLIRMPTDTGYWICYDCFALWVEDIPHDVLMKKIMKHWRNKSYMR